MFGTLGGSELLLILVIALIVFGPRQLPEIGKSIGKMLVEFRRASNDFKRTIEDEVEAEKRKTPEAPKVQAPTLEEPQAVEDAASVVQGTVPAGEPPAADETK